jgi:hypothetical protein
MDAIRRFSALQHPFYFSQVHSYFASEFTIQRYFDIFNDLFFNGCLNDTCGIQFSMNVPPHAQAQVVHQRHNANNIPFRFAALIEIKSQEYNFNITLQGLIKKNRILSQ